MTVTFPCLEVKMVKRDMVKVNNYNPNNVPADKMELLKQSIIDNGFCFPIVTIWSEDDEKYIVVDGEHRYTIAMPEWLDLPEVPIVVLQHDISQRMAATIQFNKARGVHAVDGDAEIVKSLTQQGLTDEEISKHLGIDDETILRYKSLTGITELFKGVSYSRSWEAGDFKEEEENE
jgi:ParB-like chromosome segregation protein Spo0J